MNFFAYFAIVGQIMNAAATLTAGGAVPIRTYIKGKHIQITLEEIP